VVSLEDTAVKTQLDRGSQRVFDLQHAGGSLHWIGRSVKIREF
jgi:hypothetical protein